MSTIPQPESLAAKALRDWLLWKLPAACVSVNAERAASLVAPVPGDYTVPVGAVLKVSVTEKAGATFSVSLTSGTRTAAQVASDINGAVPGLASVDTDGRLVLTSTSAPSYDASTLAPTNSIIAIGSDTTGANRALGFEPGGQWAVTSPLVPPAPDGVADGMPIGGFFVPSALGKGRICVTIGERESQPVDRNPRRGEWNVILDVGIFRTEPTAVVHQTREGIQAALRAVRACLYTDAGKQLGRAAQGDVVIALEQSVRVSPWSFRAQKSQEQPVGLLFDAASLKLGLRVFQLVDT